MTLPPSIARLDTSQDSQLPVLIAGLPGVPGYNAFFYFRGLFPDGVMGVSPPHLPGDGDSRHLNHFGGSNLLALDPEDAQAVESAFVKYRFRAVIDASGWCALKSCEYNPDLARRLNIGIGTVMMEAARRHGARLLRLSTDLVFDGNPYVRDGRPQQGDYREDWPVSPVTVYGKMMAEAEGIILDGYPEAAVLRVSLPMGPSYNGHAGAVDWIETRFRKGLPATLYFDEIRSNIYVQDLNKALAAFLRNDARGIYHVGGPRPMSLFQVAQTINRLGNYPPDLLMGCLRSQAAPIPPRVGNVSMNIDKILPLLPRNTLRPWPYAEEYAPSDPDWHGNRAQSYPEGTIAQQLYGWGWPETWDHPLTLMPRAKKTRVY